MSEKTVTHKRNIAAAVALVLLAALLIVCVQPPTQVRAKAVTTIRKRQNLRMKKLTPALKRRIAASTPAELAAGGQRPCAALPGSQAHHGKAAPGIYP